MLSTISPQKWEPQWDTPSPSWHWDIKKTDTSKCWWGREEWNSHPGCWKGKMMESLGKEVWQFSQKLNVDPQWEPALPFLSIYLRNKSRCPQRSLYMYAHSSFICNNPQMKTLQILSTVNGRVTYSGPTSLSLPFIIFTTMQMLYLF